MSSSGIAISVKNVSKSYYIYDHPKDRLKQFVFPRLRRFANKERKDYFREFRALTDVGFEARKGETVGIIGRNGSGKSTLLQIICGVLSPTNGNVVTSGRVAALLELGAGFNAEFSGRENVYLNGSLLGLTRQEIDERFEDIAAFADIGEFIDQPVKTYSSGMYVRLAFAVMTHVDADILVVDEALAVGDIYFSQKCMRYFDEFKRSQGTLLFVSHDMTSVNTICDKAVWLHEGVARKIGEVKDVCSGYLEDYYESRSVASSPGVNRFNGDDNALVGECTENLGAVKNVIESGNDWIQENIIVLSEFNTDAAYFGVGGAEIYSAGFRDENGGVLSEIRGSLRVKFFVNARIDIQMNSPAIGFVVKNNKGRVIYDLSTYFPLEKRDVQFPAGSNVTARFDYIMPILAKGEYLISVAIAEGDAFDHIQYHWMHDVIRMTVVDGPYMQGDMWVLDPKVEVTI
jgi:lipopolysaccharide transport system ATP-binding protein